MNEQLNKLLLSNRIPEVGPDAFTLYAYLLVSPATDYSKRCAVQHQAVVAEVNLQSVGPALGFQPDGIQSLIRKLTDAGWVKPTIFGVEFGKYGNGNKITWLTEVQNAKSIAGQIRQQATSRPKPPTIKPAKSNPLEGCSDDLLSQMPEKNLNRLINQHYKQTYETVFGEKAGFMKTAKEASLNITVFRMCNESFESTKNYIDFVLENWQSFRTTYNVNGLPMPSLLCQGWFYGIYRDTKENGFKSKGRGNDRDGMADRASEARKEQTDGW